MIEKLINNKTMLRFTVYKRIYTPYEIEKCYSDESIYEDTMYKFGIIDDYQEIPNDILLKFRMYDTDTVDMRSDDMRYFEYYRLSEIRIAEFDYDKKLLVE